MSPVVATPRLHWGLGAAVLLVFAWSAYRPQDRLTWLLEAFPVPLAAGLIALAWPRWRFTPLALVLIAMHACILLVGSKYTYAEVPLFNWLRDEYGLARNYYDRVGHVFQGFVPAIVAREILVRNDVVRRGGWLLLCVTSICLAFSAFYEMIEWWVAASSGEAAAAFLGTQGDVWDTQWDMFLALCGAIAAQLALGRWHDRLMGEAPAGRSAAAPVTLRELTEDNIDWAAEVRVIGDQRFHVASFGKSMWQMAARDDCWLRAIFVGEDPVGFVAMRDRGGGELYLARLLVDFRHQGRGYGKEAIRLALAHARSHPGCNRVTLSHVPSNARVGRLYERFGFRYTGSADEDGEREMRLDLA